MNGPNGSGSTTGYRVEVRDTGFNPQGEVAMLQDGAVGPEWREVVFNKDGNPAGVPGEEGFPVQFTSLQLLPFESALALAWTIIAQHRFSIGLQCRLVQHRAEYRWSCQRLGVADLPELASHCFRRVTIVKETETQEGQGAPAPESTGEPAGGPKAESTAPTSPPYGAGSLAAELRSIDREMAELAEQVQRLAAERSARIRVYEGGAE